ncbi:MAG TPA: PRC-barrel domain-containing protein [Thermomicrobiales bacterium]|nr:PRC-barrel domain-containing protein [Thermomicrobiales bacterium]
MPVQFDEPAPRNEPDSPARQAGAPETVAGLFENDLDARQALLRLRKSDVPPDTISVMMCVHESDDGTTLGHGAVAPEIVATGLQTLANWLIGFASVIVPERGTYLVAGPLGALLAGDHVTENDGEDESHAIAAVLRRFGFTRDEAAYMDIRLASGSLFASVTSSDSATLRHVAHAMSSESAVYIARADTDVLAAESASRLLVTPPEASTDGDVVVTDAVARFFRYCDSGRACQGYADIRGRHIVDPDGRDVGVIVEFIAETMVDANERSERDVVRYAIVAFGGILGISKRHAAIPIGQFALDQNPVRMSVSRERLRDAPTYDHVTPFSRREERAVCDYFGAQPYWSDGG